MQPVPETSPGSDPAVAESSPRQRLIEAAARLLGEDGPSALSTRRLARETETSTMAVYTHFGGMPALVGAVVAEGFARLEQRVAAVPLTDDPLADLRAVAAAYRDNARDNPHLYAVMFGSVPLGLELTQKQRDVGRPAFEQLVAAVARVGDAGHLRDEPAAAAAQFWSALHGYVMLEHAGFHHVVDDPEGAVLWPMLDNLMVGLMSQ
jgi:AcrR family transcriptional regulator